MYIGVDIGGTKTLLAVFTNDGQIVESKKIPTPATYEHWLLEVAHALTFFKHQDFNAGGVGMPATEIDRELGRGIKFGNLNWRNAPVRHDLEKLCKCPFVVENDAKMAALSEAMLRKDVSRVLYVTISTGIGYGLVVDQVIDTNLGDGGGRTIVLEHRGERMSWEDFAGGRAIVERYGKKAVDIHDEETWTKICRDLAQGLNELISITQPELIVIGGSVGVYFERFGSILAKQLKDYHLPLVKMPKLEQAERPEEAVAFGCFDYAKQVYGHDS